MTVKEFNAYEVVKAEVNAAAISRRLTKVRERSEKIGRGQAWKASPRSVGFRVRQATPWTVEVWWRSSAGEEASVTEDVYAAMTADLKSVGYDVARHPGPGLNKGQLQVTRRREPTPEEWAVLDGLAPHPLDCDRHGSAEGLTVEAVHPLFRSGLAELITYPLVRRHAYDPAQGFMIALSADGRKLLEARIAHERWLRDARSLGLVPESASEAAS